LSVKQDFPILAKWRSSLGLFPWATECLLPTSILFPHPRNTHSHEAGEQEDMKVFREWVKKRKELFEMGKKRGEEDIPPRGMPVSTGLDILAWRSDTPLKKVLSWFDIDLEYGDNKYLTSLNNMSPPGGNLFSTDQRRIWPHFSDFYSSFEEKI